MPSVAVVGQEIGTEATGAVEADVAPGAQTHGSSSRSTSAAEELA